MDLRKKNPHDRMPDRAEHGNLRSNIFFIESTRLLDRDDRVLEIGTGFGAMLHHLRSQGFQAVGVEIDADCIGIARQKWGDLPVTHVRNEKLPFDSNSFDVVLSFDVFEHIPDIDQHLAEVRRVLKDGGRYLLQSPNKWTNSVFETIRWRSLTKWRKGHCSLHSYRGFQRRFRRHNFEVEFFDVPVVNDYFKTKVRAYLGPVGVALLSIANPDRLPMPLRTNFYLAARKL